MMPRTRTFLPSTDDGLLSFAQNASSFLNAAPSAYGLTGEQAMSFDEAYSEYNDALVTARHSSTRTKPNIERKNEKRRALVKRVRETMEIVQAHPGTTDAMRDELKITVRDRRPTPVPVPDTSPVIEVISVLGRRVSFKLRSTDAADRGKPDGVKGAVVFTATGEQEPTTVEAFKFEGNITVIKSFVDFPASVSAGSKVWLMACWFNPKLETGLACSPVPVYLAGGVSRAG